MLPPPPKSHLQPVDSTDSLTTCSLRSHVLWTDLLPIDCILFLYSECSTFSRVAAVSVPSFFFFNEQGIQENVQNTGVVLLFFNFCFNYDDITMLLWMIWFNVSLCCTTNCLLEDIKNVLSLSLSTHSIHDSTMSSIFLETLRTQWF